MRGIYARIFLSVWLAMLLVGITLVVLAVTTDPRRGELGRREARLREVGQLLITAYERGGAEQLRQEQERVDRTEGLRVSLFRGEGGSLSGDPVGPGLRRVARAADATGEVQHRRGRQGMWLVGLPLSSDYVMAALLPPPSLGERLWNPRLLTLRLVVTFLFASGLCLLIARTIAAPVRTLRRATRRFAEGDFSVRISPELARSTNEISGLARDFDVMAERTEALITAQKRLVTDVSHELRSPLTRLGLAAELVRRRCGDAAGEPLNRIDVEVRRLNEIIGQLLTLSALESGAGRSSREPVQLGELAAEVADDARFEASQRNRTVDVSLADGELWVLASASVLRQALDNVVRNALRYAPEGTAVEIGLRRQGENAVVTVRDHGPGVPASLLGRLFEPFYRVDEDRDRKSGGVGIGLSIAERAVRIHGGSVSAGNAPGGGLLVELTLPLGERTGWQED